VAAVARSAAFGHGCGGRGLKSELFVAPSDITLRKVDREFVALVEAELADEGVHLGRESIEVAAASLAVNKNLLLNGGSQTQRVSLARALGSAAATRGACNGAIELRVRRMREDPGTWGLGLLEDASVAGLWLLIDAIDQWPFARTGLIRAIDDVSDTTRVIATASSRTGQPADVAWRAHRSSFAWINVSG
jgi:hypothetical protein